MKINTSVFKHGLLAAAVCASVISAPAFAHRAWLLPQSTVLAGDEPMVTIDGAISNSIFIADYHALRSDGLEAHNNQGEQVELQNLHTGRFRTSFDLTLAEPGTYRIASASRGMTARWQNSDGSRGMFPGRGQPHNDAALSDAVPDDAENVQIGLMSRRIETFVTAGAPTQQTIAATGEGLEMVFHTHPNDLFNGETAQFQLMIDGEPASAAEVILIKDGARYRNQQGETEFTTDSEGRFEVQWTEPGMYWLEASYQDESAPAPATSRRGSYAVTLEVLPE
ncbi:DUF4198 domain-containing protein [Aliidiomarina soli]|uniref:DUF4198 domain-containing protein n=1 Tax=Aliidiomarina soli TaxID=1928574 RepID=A0A432WFF8_9GAMM|nr:DUF4198 domain-containing protein [Aliidiomarina soli]RUO32508.1 DUF4198 domain-containing protein [Aliidiomarina soli]